VSARTAPLVAAIWTVGAAVAAPRPHTRPGGAAVGAAEGAGAGGAVLLVLPVLAVDPPVADPFKGDTGARPTGEGVLRAHAGGAGRGGGGAGGGGGGAACLVRRVAAVVVGVTRQPAVDAAAVAALEGALRRARERAAVALVRPVLAAVRHAVTHQVYADAVAAVALVGAVGRAGRDVALQLVLCVQAVHRPVAHV